MTEAQVYQLYHPDPNGCPALAVDGPPQWAFFFRSEWGEPPMRQQYAKVVSWKQNCYLCPYCGTRVESGAWRCWDCQGHFLGRAGTRCLGHMLEGRTVPHHILKEAANAKP